LETPGSGASAIPGSGYREGMLHLVAVKPDGVNTNPWLVGLTVVVIAVIALVVVLRRRRR